MQANTPQIGMYQVLKAYDEMHNGKPTPIAEVIFKQFSWAKFDYKVRKIRLRSLYNSSSVGPKEQYPSDSLYLHYLLIHDMFEMEDPKNPQKKLYAVNWEVSKPDNYDALIMEEDELAADFIIQDSSIALNLELLANELLYDEIERSIAYELTESVHKHQYSDPLLGE